MGVKYTDLEGRFTDIELLDGSKIFGTIKKWSRSVVWVDKDNACSIVDIPKEITQRILTIV